MGNIEEQVKQMYDEFQREIPVIHKLAKCVPLIEQFQREIPVIHRAVSLIKEFQREIPVIHTMVKSIPVIEKERAFLFCQLNAIVQYHLGCAAAAKKLASDLEKCKRLMAPPRRRRPR